MNMFANMSRENLEETEDRVSGGFEPKPSDVYTAKIKLAYVGKAQSSDAQSITIHADIDGQEFRETIWVTNKKGENFYTDKDDAKKKRPLPGFVTVDDLCMFVTEKGLAEQDIEEKVVKLYNFTEKKELPTPVPVITSLIDGEIKLAIFREVVDKEAKDGNGNYQPTGETRSQNTIDKVMHPETGRTLNEYKHNIETPEFMTAWIERNKGKDRVRAKGAAAGAGATGTGRPGAVAQGAKTSLFG